MFVKSVVLLVAYLVSFSNADTTEEPLGKSVLDVRAENAGKNFPLTGKPEEDGRSLFKTIEPMFIIRTIPATYEQLVQDANQKPNQEPKPEPKPEPNQNQVDNNDKNQNKDLLMPLPMYYSYLYRNYPIMPMMYLYSGYPSYYYKFTTPTTLLMDVKDSREPKENNDETIGGAVQEIKSN